jgi:peptidoglycan/LPS O-acetylase OafA/YrhL
MEKDNFNLVRLALSLIVVFAHIRDLTAKPEIYYFTYFFDSDLAIKAFFSISGFLVFKSFVTTDNIYKFAKKRILRIYPAYITSLLFCLIVGYICSTLNLTNFLFSYETFKYISANLIFMNFLQPNLPNSLSNNPLFALNGSLWTIKIEILFYILTPILIILYKKLNIILYITLIILFSSIWILYFKIISDNIYSEQLIRQLPAQLSYFAIGGIIYLNKIIFNKLNYLTILSCISLIFLDSEIISIILKPIFYSIITIFTCTKLYKKIQITKEIDLSYGIYLFHFPIIQLLIHKDIFNFNIYLGVILTIIMSFTISLLSWLYIERLFKKK